MITKPNKARLPIGGFLRQSLLDYPGFLSCIVYTQGCNMRCSYCHNPNLVYPELIRQSKRIEEQEVLEWISSRRQLLDAVVITGGEPTLHKSLPAFIQQVKDMGMRIKLDTNGSNPDLLQQLAAAKQVDYIAMDIKAPLIHKAYNSIMTTPFKPTDLTQISESIRFLNSASVPYEYRVTLAKSLTPAHLEEILNCTTGTVYLQPVRKQGSDTTEKHPHITDSHIQLLQQKYHDRSIHIR